MRLSNVELAAAYAEMAAVCSKLSAHYGAEDAEPAWLAVARGELGVKEAPGSADNPRVVEYHGSTAAGEAPDSVPWCASFVGWCLEQAGVAGTRRKAARSYLNWGEHLDGPRPGCVVVLRRGRAPAGHVGFVVSPGKILGGNQSDAVSIKTYDESEVLGYRWPDAQVRES